MTSGPCQCPGCDRAGAGRLLIDGVSTLLCSGHRARYHKHKALSPEKPIRTRPNRTQTITDSDNRGSEPPSKPVKRPGLSETGRLTIAPKKGRPKGNSRNSGGNSGPYVAPVSKSDYLEPLSDDEIRTRYGALIDEFISVVRVDASYTTDLIQKAKRYRRIAKEESAL